MIRHHGHGGAATTTTEAMNGDRRRGLTGSEAADMAVASELAVTFARWGYPAVLSAGEADQRARDIEGLARMARQAVGR